MKERDGRRKEAKYFKERCMRICVRERILFEWDKGLPGGISCPALYCQGLCVGPDAAGSSLGSSLGRAATECFCLSLGLGISLSQYLFQVGRSFEPDTSSGGESKLRGRLNALNASSWLIL